MTEQQARERLAMMQASSAQNVPQQLPSGFNAGGMQSGTTQQQITTLLQRAQASSNNPLQHAIQAQDPSHARQFGMPLPQGQQQQNGSGLARIGQNLNPGMGLPQGPGSLQQNLIQPSPSVPHMTAQSSSAPLASQPPPPGVQQVSGPSSLASMTLQQLHELSTHLQRIVIEGEKDLQTPSSSGGSDARRQQLRTKIENNKQFINILQEVMNSRTRAR
jgi:hypothetical protein